MMERAVEVLIVACWTALWAVGGWLLAEGAFRLRKGESELVGVGIGLVLQVWVANLLAHFTSASAGFWGAAALVLFVGLLVTVWRRPWPRPTLQPALWLALVGLTLLFYAIGRGLAIFDDYQNLPTLSLMAAGDIPPHFALNPTLRFGYHYFLLLFGAQLMLLGDMLPWTALDLARAIILALPLVLAAIWIYRLARSGVLSFLGAAVLALAGGSRWMLLLFPRGVVDRISSEISLIGSAASSAPTLTEAMISSWKIDGGGPIPFPFAFYSGVNQPYVMFHTGIAGSGILILLLLLLTAQRWRHWSAVVVTVILLASLAIANETAFLLIGLGLLIVGCMWLVARRRGPKGGSPWRWHAAGAAAFVIAVLQGGMLTELALSRLHNDATVTTYFDTRAVVAWPPAIVSAHLGSLSLVNASQAAMALLEVGPVVLVTPLVLAWGWRAFRRRRWFEAALIASSAGALVASLITFRGPLYTAAPRLLGGWLLVSVLYFVPLLWSWAARKKAWVRVGAWGIAFASCLGGAVLFAVQLVAIQRPAYATFITALDAKAASDHWDEIDKAALVFDPLVFRSPTVLGRPTWSSPTWYARYEAWEALRDGAEPQALRSAGFRYMYIDREYWEQLTRRQQAGLESPCVRSVWQVDGVRGDDDYRKDFRRLLDISACE